MEAAYPFMERNPMVNAAAHIASGIAGALVSTSAGALSSAYIPFPLAIAIAPDPLTVSAAAAASFFVPFITTLVVAEFKDPKKVQ